MALFENKKKKKEEVKKPAKVAKPSALVVIAPGSVLVRPRITEKTGHLTASNVYTFDVTTTATKRSISAAIYAEYKVSPTRVRIVNRKATRVRLRTRRGFGATNATKKAYVTVKKGDRIEFSS